MTIEEALKVLDEFLVHKGREECSYYCSYFDRSREKIMCSCGSEYLLAGSSTVIGGVNMPRYRCGKCGQQITIT